MIFWSKKSVINVYYFGSIVEDFEINQRIRFYLIRYYYKFYNNIILVDDCYFRYMKMFYVNI